MVIHHGPRPGLTQLQPLRAEGGGLCARKAACARIAFALVVMAALQGCGTLYLAQAARGQWQVMRGRQPIEKVVADEKTPAAVRARLEEVSAARDFASRELGLPNNRSYRTYSDVGRPFVVWNVVATPEFSVEPRHWCFPIAGCVAYRGYFKEASARAFAANLRRQGFDVMVSGVPAYSTLGKIADPVLNTMLGYGDTQLAAMVFHELSHQLVYVAGDTAFNEAFAVAVEQEGLGRWLTTRGRESELARHSAQEAGQQEFIGLVLRRRQELARLYASRLPQEEMRGRKQEILAALAHDVHAAEARNGVRSLYSQWAKEGLNNAHLASVATYFDCVPGFERLLAATGGNLPAFYASVREISGRPRAERHLQLCTGPGQPK